MSRLGSKALLSTILLSLATFALAQDAPPNPPLYEQDPYDQITVDEANGSGTFKVLPLEIPDRQLPKDPLPNALLTVRMLDQPDVEAQIAWRNIAKVELFEQLVLNEVQRLLLAQDFEAAYDHLAFLHEHYSTFAGLAEATRDFRYRNAGALFRQQRLAEALALLEEVHREEPQRSGLAAALANVSQPLFDAYVKGEQFDAARLLVERTAQRGDEASTRLSKAWQDRLASDARTQERIARTRFAAERFREANDAARRMLTIWPEFPGGRELAREISLRWPMTRVGVAQTQPTVASRFPVEQAAFRIATLSQRPLAQLASFGPDGAIYTSPVGRVAAADNRRSLTIQSTGVTAYDISAALLSQCDPQQPTYDPLWASLMKSASVAEVYRTKVDLLRAHPQPLALLTTTTIGRRYDVAASTPARTEYLAREIAGGPREVIETSVSSSAAALADLSRGRLDVVERIDPRDAAALADDRSLRLGRYAVPRIHLLVPNSRRIYPANSTFRRALAYALPRAKILREDVLGGVDADGCRTISGPFPAGGPQETWAYGNDKAIAPLAYEPRMALTLLRVAESELARAKMPSKDQPPQRKALVIGHSAAALHRRACEAMAESLTRIGIPCEHKEIAFDDQAAFAVCDFWYLECAVHEPVVDAPRMFGAFGLVDPSPFLTLAVRDVTIATNAQQASQRLHALHAIIHAEQSVIPLWQLVDQFAHRTDLSGISTVTVSIYSDVDRWRLAAETLDVAENP